MALAALLDGVMQVRDTLARPVPIFLKIAPDLTPAEIANIATVARDAQVDAVIATNTTLNRDGLQSVHRDQAGGLSGAPLMHRSTQVLAQLFAHLKGDIPLIGVGGVASADDALTKIRAGASAIQLYTALIYGGITLGARIAEELDTKLAQEGFGSVAEAVGTAA